ncbi:MAG: hypothetical protein R3Y05_05175 [bacterium]
MQLNYIELLIVFIISIIPIISGVVIYKLYNSIQGIITYLFLNYVIYFISLELVGHKSFLNEIQLEMLLDALVLPYNIIYYAIFLIPKLDEVITINEKYTILTIVVLIYIFTQIISVTIKRLRYLNK